MLRLGLLSRIKAKYSIEKFSFRAEQVEELDS